MTKILYFIKVALIFTGSFSIAQPISKEGGKEAKTIVFTGVNIIPMNREVVLKNMTLVVKNGRISAFGNTKDIAIPEDAEVKIIVYNNVGEQIAELVNQYFTKGTYNVLFNAAYFPSGVYYYQMNANSYSKTNKMILLK